MDVLEKKKLPCSCRDLTSGSFHPNNLGGGVNSNLKVITSHSGNLSTFIAIFHNMYICYIND